MKKGTQTAPTLGASLAELLGENKAAIINSIRELNAVVVFSPAPKG